MKIKLKNKITLLIEAKFGLESPLFNSSPLKTKIHLNLFVYCNKIMHRVIKKI